MMQMFEIFFKLAVGWAIADFGLQLDAMAKGKNRHRQAPDLVPEGQKPVAVWPYYLTAHALIHAGMVWWATGSIWLGLTEFVLHWLIDYAKCENLTNPHGDQLLHLICRLLYLLFT